MVLSDDRLDWWANRVYDAREFARFTVDENATDEEQYRFADPALAVMHALQDEMLGRTPPPPRDLGLLRTEHPNALTVISYGSDEVLMRWGGREPVAVEMAVLRSIVAQHGDGA